MWADLEKEYHRLQMIENGLVEETRRPGIARFIGTVLVLSLVAGLCLGCLQVYHGNLRNLGMEIHESIQFTWVMGSREVSESFSDFSKSGASSGRGLMLGAILFSITAIASWKVFEYKA